MKDRIIAIIVCILILIYALVMIIILSDKYDKRVDALYKKNHQLKLKIKKQNDELVDKDVLISSLLDEIDCSSE